MTASINLPGSLPSDLIAELKGCTITGISSSSNGSDVRRVSFRFTELLGCEVDIQVAPTVNGCVRSLLVEPATANDAFAGLLELGDKYWIADAVAQAARAYLEAQCKNRM